MSRKPGAVQPDVPLHPPEGSPREVREEEPRRTCVLRNKKSPLTFRSAGFLKNPGSDLLSHHLAMAVPSAQEGLTSVFGMGTGGTPPVWPPGISLFVKC